MGTFDDACIFRDVPPLREVRKKMFREGKEVGFVATMGALHDGHMSLVKHALEENTDVFVSIFVNPTQFAAHEDLDAYPQTWEEDLKKLKQIQDEHAASSGPNSDSRIRGIFAPTVKVMYPTLPPSSDIAGNGSFVTITPLGNQLEGASRPIFFRGVATVCTKLFNVIQADRVYFGQKDVQQSVLIKRMVKDFLIPTKVRVIPTSREPDGLAMSSRNVYLGERRRKDAVVLSKALFAARDLYNAGELRGAVIRNAATEVFRREAVAKRKDGKLESSCQIEIDYVALSDPENMAMIRDSDKIDPSRGAILSAAVYVQPVDGPKNQDELDQRLVRLIDNVIFEPRE
ncbi:pantoate-beta-alanine ligase [Elasticomyces elasticus]|uniref:Pantoate--beta-alanine ligase n=1 Tax=Exophiala sideris TaxID=1016849 RepID=A0ABR0JIT3_9EURO|nr:pantoate-beta-alanine ligase [Elasticomyces elasticus]KAK5033522.1 pantoate-beta-alanine ligase [Exophiala sideris]KAK5041983.1 pantoate-beta-alanine ligase [Exophiala sideris]KAK5064066.1 pantoate-beta-alanine ligase [Exophiala sideris]KAK5185251.1 pantoate-beta-alanine ligase [Eurotiomycetes sp. CCFEE 6388]